MTQVKGKRKTRRGLNNNNNNGNKKAKVVCWACGKQGHKKSECIIWKHEHGLSNQKAKTMDNFEAMINDKINVVLTSND